MYGTFFRQLGGLTHPVKKESKFEVYNENILIKLLNNVSKIAITQNVKINNCFEIAAFELTKYIDGMGIHMLLEKQKPFMKKIKEDLDSLDEVLHDGVIEFLKTQAKSQIMDLESETFKVFWDDQATYYQMYKQHWKKSVNGYFGNFKKHMRELHAVLRLFIEEKWIKTHKKFVKIYNDFVCCVVAEHPTIAAIL